MERLSKEQIQRKEKELQENLSRTKTVKIRAEGGGALKIGGGRSNWKCLGRQGVLTAKCPERFFGNRAAKDKIQLRRKGVLLIEDQKLIYIYGVNGEVSKEKRFSEAVPLSA
ncbi:hypothetical protein TNCV_1687291 [Trichonephila clavipes]|nr:hypothetical protein TNCV_1687291 [Trichonephila clavipes]